MRKRSQRRRKEIYFTFDDGPSEMTELLLKQLKRTGIRASFFVTASEGEHPELLKKIVDQGHVICLHSYSHKYSQIYCSVECYMDDLKRIDDLVYEATGVRSKILRFPGGTDNTRCNRYSKGIMPVLIEEVEKMGYQYIDWNCENYDGKCKRKTLKYIAKGIFSIRNNRQQPAVFLAHNRPGDYYSIKSIPYIVWYCKLARYEIKVLDENIPQVKQLPAQW